MLDVKKILCPTDFSDASKKAIEVAVPLAEKFGAEIHLLHVVPPMPHLEASVTAHFDVPEYERLLSADAKKNLSALAKSTGKVKTHEILSHGQAAEEILRAADENKIDLIVIATAGHTGWDRAVFGSVAEKVVRRARCPVLTIRRPDAAR
jgi:nucleotide-binding universal stress UspA family protein